MSILFGNIHRPCYRLAMQLDEIKEVEYRRAGNIRGKYPVMRFISRLRRGFVAKQCTYCGQTLPRDDARFCNNCGKTLPSVNDQSENATPSTQQPSPPARQLRATVVPQQSPAQPYVNRSRNSLIPARLSTLCHV